MNQHSDIVDILNAVLDTLVKYKEAIGTLERKLGDTKSQKLVASTKNKIKDLKEEMEKFKESKAQPKSLIKLNVNPSKQGGWEGVDDETEEQSGNESRDEEDNSGGQSTENNDSEDGGVKLNSCIPQERMDVDTETTGDTTSH
jgi:hypothetical protein